MELWSVLSLLCVVWIFAAFAKLKRTVREQRDYIEALDARLHRLERAGSAAEQPISRVVAHEPPPLPVAVAREEPAGPPPLPGIPFPVLDEPIVTEPIAPPPLPRPQPVEPAVPLEDRIRGWVGDQEWEALVGGSILNKIGAVVLVVGIALFLAYSFAHMGPGGRAATSILVSCALLGAGVWTERRETYRVFARGLIGAGWAALYATAYAIYALPAAQIIENPIVGSIVMLGVAAGMVGHSLKYRSQAVTAVAFFAAFTALIVTPSTPFAVVALIPLAAALLYLAQRFDWYEMALMGLAATYGACASRGSSGAPVEQTEALFIVYWLLFELFDLMRFARGLRGWAIEWIFPLNAAGFLTLSTAAWLAKAPERIWVFPACASLLYLLSALWRAKIEMAREAPDSEDLPTRLRAGNYEGAAILASVLAGVAIVEKLSGWSLTMALAFEAQMIFSAGARFRSKTLRALAAVGFALTLFFLIDSSASKTTIQFFGADVDQWAPLAAMIALMLYGNRALSAAGSVIGTAFSWCASALLLWVIVAEANRDWAGAICLVFAMGLFELGLRKSLMEFRWQSYGVAVIGLPLIWLLAIEEDGLQWIAIAFALLVAYAGALRSQRLEDESGNLEWYGLNWAVCGSTALSAAALATSFVIRRHSGDMWWWCIAPMALALVFLELGIRGVPKRLLWFCYPAAISCVPMLFIANLTRGSAIPYGVVGGMAWAMSARFGSARKTSSQTAFAIFGTSLGIVRMGLSTRREFVPAAWAAMAFVIHEAGRFWNVASYRWIAQLTTGLAALVALAVTMPEGSGEVILAIVLLIALHLAFRVRTDPREARIAPAHLVAAAVLAAALIYREVSGSLLTVAWGAEALVLLGSGFAFRERPLRIEGLLLFLVCILKLFLYDLRNLETPYRILSFIALGLILLGVSWVYTRFRGSLTKLL